MVETVVYPIGLVPLPEYLQMIDLSSIIDASCPLFVGDVWRDLLKVLWR